MNYTEALAACIDAIRNGEAHDRAIERYPEHARALQEDLSLAAEVRAYAARAVPSADAATRARQRLNGELATLRARHEAAVAPPRPFWSLRPLQGLSIAAVVIVAALGFVAFAAGILGGATTAEAETIEGIVVEQADGSLVVQTPDGLQTVQLDETSSVTDESGARVTKSSIQPGQVVLVQVKRLPNGALRVVKVQKRPLAALVAWCKLHPLRCQEVEPRLPQAALGCQADGSCPPLPTPATGSATAERTRLQDLAERCQRLGGEPCEELRRFCRTYPTLCLVLTGWLRSLVDLPDDIRERIRLQAERCKQGSLLDCRELRLLCERLDQPCPALQQVPPDRINTPIKQDSRPAVATPSLQRIQPAPTATPVVQQNRPLILNTPRVLPTARPPQQATPRTVR